MAAICAYSVSGFYSPVYRYLYYSLLVLSIILHRTGLVVRGALGTCMVYSSIASIHAVALASVRGRGTVDLDIIPAFAITGVGMLAGMPIMVWSNTLRGARTSTRMVLFAWVVVLWVGLIASMASMKALPEPKPCGPGPICGLTCNTTLPMRDGQVVVIVPFRWKSFLFDWSGWFTAYGTGFVLIGILMAIPRQHPFDQARAVLNNRTMLRSTREKQGGHIACCAIFGPFIAVGLGIAQIVVLEVMLMARHGLPFSRNMSAIGQWGPLVGAAFAQLALVIQQAFAEPLAVPVQSAVRLSDVEHGSPSSCRISPATLPPATIGTNAPPQLGQEPSKRFDFSTVFKEGHWWGRGLEGYVLTHEGIRWKVLDGFLRRVDDLISAENKTRKSLSRRRLTL